MDLNMNRGPTETSLSQMAAVGNTAVLANTSSNDRYARDTSDSNSENNRSRAGSDTSFSSGEVIAPKSCKATTLPPQDSCPLTIENTSNEISADATAAPLNTFHHPPAPQFPCRFRVWTEIEYECPRSFYSEYAADRHAEHTHKIHPPYPCPLGQSHCARTFKTRGGAEQHGIAHAERKADATTRHFLKHLCPLIEVYHASPSSRRYFAKTRVFLERLGSRFELYKLYHCLLTESGFCPKTFLDVAAAVTHLLRQFFGELGSKCGREFEPLYTGCQHARASHVSYGMKPEWAANPQRDAKRNANAQHRGSQHGKAEHETHRRGKVRHNAYQHAKRRDNACKRANANGAWQESQKKRVEWQRLRRREMMMDAVLIVDVDDGN